MKRNLLAIIALFIMFFVPNIFAANFGPRIPIAYIVTSGTGQSDEGVPPDPYETFSYDIALQKAGIENFNVMYYTSVLPPEAKQVSLDKVKPYFHRGSVLETIMAKVGGVQGDTLVAGIGRVWAFDPKTQKNIGGFAAEYEFKYKGKKVSAENARANAIKELTRSLDHELKIRGLKEVGKKKFDITSLYIEKKYGIALAALGFVNFIYPKPIPID